MKVALEKYRNIITAILVTFTLVTTVYAGVCVLIDFRSGKVADEKIAPLIKELQYLNCQYSVTLTNEQREAAIKMYKSVTQIGDK